MSAARTPATEVSAAASSTVVAPKAAVPARHLWMLFHRWVGLVLAGFLLLAGLTGSLMAWYHELDAWAASDLHQVAPGAAARLPRLDALSLREKVAAAFPDAALNLVDLQDPGPGRTVSFFLQAGAEGQAPPVNDEVFVDPATGEVVGERQWGAISQGWKNLAPFIYRLHFQLALGTVGTYVFGIVALLWTLDCFVGAYLTMPKRVRARAAAAKGWWSRWKPAWSVRWRSSSYRLNVDLHRAGGLWVWAMLFVFAWSSVAFNLKEVYLPATRAVLAMDDRPESLPDQVLASSTPPIAWDQALRLARRHMASEAKRLQFTVIEEQSLGYEPKKASYRYSVRSSVDIRDKSGSTQLWLDARSGELLYTYLPVGRYAGDTVTHWLTSLHMAQVWGLPFRVFVCAMGLVVAMLSVTGFVIWLKKWRARRAARNAGRVRAVPRGHASACEERLRQPVAGVPGPESLEPAGKP